MLTDLQRLDYAEAMKKMTEDERTQYLKDNQVEETTDVDVIYQLISDFAENDKAEAELAAVATAETCPAE
jgi:predicted house-cleaning noncanonical NTP pyrophosphatase (MazG superfamily)